MKNILKEKWNEMSIENKQALSLMAGMSAGLLIRGILKSCKKNDVEVINLIVPKDCELMIFVKGGK